MYFRLLLFPVGEEGEEGEYEGSHKAKTLQSTDMGCISAFFSFLSERKVRRVRMR